MTTIELKTNFHRLIDNINDDNVLMRFYDILSKVKESKNGIIWERLSKSEQEELIEMEKESRDNDNLISNSDMKNNHKKWL